MSAYIPYIITAVIIIALLVGLYFLSRYAKKLQDKQAAASEQMKVFNTIPVKKEVKAMVSGIYITGVKGLRTGLDKAPEKKKFIDKVKGIFKK